MYLRAAEIPRVMLTRKGGWPTRQGGGGAHGAGVLLRSHAAAGTKLQTR
jgi:hypothetical protein